MAAGRSSSGQHEQVGVDAVYGAPQPIGAGNARVEFGEAAQEGAVRVAPIDDVIAIVAARDRAANHQEQKSRNGYAAFQA
jgi:hypothetical protein